MSHLILTFLNPRTYNNSSWQCSKIYERKWNSFTRFRKKEKSYLSVCFQYNRIYFQRTNLSFVWPVLSHRCLQKFSNRRIWFGTFHCCRNCGVPSWEDKRRDKRWKIIKDYRGFSNITNLHSSYKHNVWYGLFHILF